MTEITIFIDDSDKSAITYFIPFPNSGFSSVKSFKAVKLYKGTLRAYDKNDDGFFLCEKDDAVFEAPEIDKQFRETFS